MVEAGAIKKWLESSHSNASFRVRQVSPKRRFRQPLGGTSFRTHVLMRQSLAMLIFEVPPKVGGHPPLASCYILYDTYHECHSYFGFCSITCPSLSGGLAGSSTRAPGCSSISTARWACSWASRSRMRWSPFRNHMCKQKTSKATTHTKPRKPYNKAGVMMEPAGSGGGAWASFTVGPINKGVFRVRF